MDGLIKIRDIEAPRKTLAKSFFEFGKMDLKAYDLLKGHLPSLAIFHLQQAAEKVAKAMLILDMNDIDYKELKKHNFIYVLEQRIRKHNQELRDINNLENAMFRQAFTYASPKFLDFLKSDNIENRERYSKQIEEDIKLQNEITNLKAKLDSVNDGGGSKLKKLIEKKERKLLDSGLFTKMLEKDCTKKKILCMNSEEIKSFMMQDRDDPSPYIFSDESRKALLPFFNILFLTVITYSHEADTRYPAHDGSIKDYTDTGIFKASNSVHKKLYEIINQSENLVKECK